MKGHQPLTIRLHHNDDVVVARDALQHFAEDR